MSKGETRFSRVLGDLGGKDRIELRDTTAVQMRTRCLETGSCGHSWKPRAEAMLLGSRVSWKSHQPGGVCLQEASDLSQHSPKDPPGTGSAWDLGRETAAHGRSC